MRADVNEIGNIVPAGRYYTKTPISDLLVALMADRSPSRLLDLGSGTGSLTAAARERWASANIVTVDIDRAAFPQFRKIEGIGAVGHHHVVADVLDADLPTLLPHGVFDAAICNPPYGRSLSWKPSFKKILRDAGLCEAGISFEDAGAETMFLAQNLRLTHASAQLGLIVPDGLITGQRSMGIRRALLTQHRIECAVQLPRGSFFNTDAQAFILVLRKGLASRKIRLHRLSLEGTLSAAIAIDRQQAIRRLDYNYYESIAETSSPITLEDVGAEVVRGRFQSAEVRGLALKGANVFHTTSFPDGRERARCALSGGRIFRRCSETAWARTGDILLARVDRALHRKVCLVVSGSAPISDCVFRIRVPPKWRKAVFRSLISHAGEWRLRTTARGVAAQMIAKGDLMRMPLDL
jgi:type I restriction enzyme M protein